MEKVIEIINSGKRTRTNMRILQQFYLIQTGQSIGGCLCSSKDRQQIFTTVKEYINKVYEEENK